MNEARELLFPGETLKIFETSPADGETEAGEFEQDWRARRVTPTTDGSNQAPTGEWQFEISSADDWETSQAFMIKAAALKIGDRRWKIQKVEKPAGHSLVWKLKGKIQ